VIRSRSPPRVRVGRTPLSRTVTRRGQGRHARGTNLSRKGLPPPSRLGARSAPLRAPHHPDRPAVRAEWYPPPSLTDVKRQSRYAKQEQSPGEQETGTRQGRQRMGANHRKGREVPLDDGKLGGIADASDGAVGTRRAPANPTSNRKSVARGNHVSCPERRTESPCALAGPENKSLYHNYLHPGQPECKSNGRRHTLWFVPHTSACVDTTCVLTTTRSNGPRKPKERSA
jgi:hypothetical protein